MQWRVLLTVMTLIVLGSLVLASRGCRESLTYEIYAVQSNYELELVAKGTLTTQSPHVQAFEGGLFPMRLERRWVELSSGFSVGATVVQKNQLDGFGLWIRRDGAGFSWNSFTRESGQIFRKRQGTGRVEAIGTANQDYQELAAVKFLDDVTLTGNLGLVPVVETHQVIIKRGSILRLAQ